ncbi:MAG: putative glycosyltransferase EpsF [Firmicutes bacterium ADurb.Bin419]|nr:MAG: putative glycosyltransferase EpsF [Firmicutes bacterium ADurb.Bin419]
MWDCGYLSFIAVSAGRESKKSPIPPKFTINISKNINVFKRIILESIQLKKFLKSNKYGVIHVHSGTPLRIFYLVAAKLAGVKSRIYHSHSADIIGKEKSKKVIYRLLKSLFPLFATHCFACSDAAARWMYTESVFRSNKVVVIHNGIDTTKFQFSESIRAQYRRELGLEEKFVVGHTGRFNEQKNHRFIIEVFSKIAQKSENAVLMLIGTGELEAEIKEKVIGYNLQDKVRFLGVRDDVGNLLQAMDVYFMPSKYEGLPVAAVEAQCTGLPCVFSDNITDEVALIKQVKFLALDDSIDKWADAVLADLKLNRKDACHVVKTSGYDVKDAALKLSKYYIQ